MIVTYLIGNGFDLGIGLHTDYKHFLKYYIGTPSSKECIVQFKKKISKDTIELWADFEKCFGEYISNFNDETINDYISIYEDVLFELNNYLKSEADKLSNEISKEEEQQIINWIRLTGLSNIGFRPAITDNFFTHTRYNLAELNITYHFLTFNYTDVLDKMIKKIKASTNNILFSHEKGPNRYIRQIGELIHVHGQLDRNLIMGVNDAKQLPFSGNLPDKIKRRVIKPTKNKSMGYQIDEQATKIINDSTIICIYGMSIGETDTIWWERIGKWIQTNENKRLIYFVYDTNIKNETVYEIDRLLDAEEMYAIQLLTSLKIPKEKFEIVKQQIIVIINSKFMQLNKTKELSNV